MLANATLPPPSPNVYIKETCAKPPSSHNYFCDSNGLTSYLEVLKDSNSNLQLGIALDQYNKLAICVDYKNGFQNFNCDFEIKLISTVSFFVASNGNYKCHRWGCECKKPDEIALTLARRFSLLSHKALNNTLSEEDFLYWRNIVEDIDYADYYTKIVSPIFLTAKVVAVKKGKVTIRRLADNRLMNITGNAIDSCKAWRVGDNIEMLVMLDEKQDISFIKHADLVDSSPMAPRDLLGAVEVIRI